MVILAVRKEQGGVSRRVLWMRLTLLRNKR